MTEVREKEENEVKQDKEPQIETEHLTTKFFDDLIEHNKDIEIIFRDGEKMKGRIQWFDRWNIKLSNSDDKECLIYRHAIKGYLTC
ncbi:MAG: RNA chaperone Hfq [Candidatus Eremiobacterota bacterium]